MAAGRRSSSERVTTASGRQYHLDVGPDDVAPFVLLCGEAARAERIASRFERIDVERRQREYVTITGSFEGAPLTVTATGIGADNTEIAVVELCQCAPRPTFLRVGSCGALKDAIRLGDLVISTGALRMETTSLHFVPEGYPATAHPEVVLALVQSCEERRLRFHAGITATAPGFYGAQGRAGIDGFPPRRPDLPDELARIGALNLEMEASALFTLASLRGLRAGAVCAVYAQRKEKRFATEAERAEADGRSIDAALGAVLLLRAMDARKGDRPFWHPGLGL